MRKGTCFVREIIARLKPRSTLQTEKNSSRPVEAARGWRSTDWPLDQWWQRGAFKWRDSRLRSIQVRHRTTAERRTLYSKYMCICLRKVVIYSTYFLSQICWTCTSATTGFLQTILTWSPMNRSPSSPSATQKVFLTLSEFQSFVLTTRGPRLTTAFRSYGAA